MGQKRSWTSAWIVGVGVVAASALLAFWFLPERERADVEFAKEYSWIKEEGVDAIVSAGADLPDFEMMRKMDQLEARHD